jgi:hypothetical protein
MILIFTCLIVVQFFIILGHDLIDIPGLLLGSKVQARIGKRRVWLASLVNSIFPGVAAGFAILFWHRLQPAYVLNYWVIYCSIAVLSAIGMWYIPYLRGASEAQKQDYLLMYEGTRHVLPKRGDNPRPNLFHMGIHVLFVLTLCMALVLRIQR